MNIYVNKFKAEARKRKSNRTKARKDRVNKVTIDENNSSDEHKYQEIRKILKKYKIDLNIVTKLPEKEFAETVVKRIDENVKSKAMYNDKLASPPAIKKIAHDNTFVGDSIKTVYKGIDIKTLKEYDSTNNTIYSNLYDDIGSIINDTGINSVLSVAERILVFLLKIFLPNKWVDYAENVINALFKTIKIYLTYRKYATKLKDKFDKKQADKSTVEPDSDSKSLVLSPA